MNVLSKESVEIGKERAQNQVWENTHILRTRWKRGLRKENELSVSPEFCLGLGFGLILIGFLSIILTFASLRIPRGHSANAAISLGSNRRDFSAGSSRTRLGSGSSTTPKSISSSVILGLDRCGDKVRHGRADGTWWNCCWAGQGWDG